MFFFSFPLNKEGYASVAILAGVRILDVMHHNSLLWSTIVF